MESLPPMPDHMQSVLDAAVDGPEFFPRSTFPVSTLHEFKRRYVEGALVLLDELPLANYHCDGTVAAYRFVWLRTFDPAVIVRVSELDDGGGMVVAKTSSKEAGFGIGSITRQKEGNINRRGMEKLRHLVSQGEFWEMPTNSEAHGLDGADWTLEVVLPGRYHVASRWSPDSGLIRAMGQEMIRLSGFWIGPRKIY